jgi:hypothetical protein
MTITREQLLESLHSDWGTFVDRFQRLSPEAQAAYLQQQGYARFADLLAHVIAWWQAGLSAIPAMLDDPDYTSPDHDVAAFNAQAVETFRSCAGSSVTTIFMDLYQKWLQLVNRLPDAAFQNNKIEARLHIELMGHFAEHHLA